LFNDGCGDPIFVEIIDEDDINNFPAIFFDGNYANLSVFIPRGGNMMRLFSSDQLFCIGEDKLTSSLWGHFLGQR